MALKEFMFNSLNTIVKNFKAVATLFSHNQGCKQTVLQCYG